MSPVSRIMGVALNVKYLVYLHLLCVFLQTLVLWFLSCKRFCNRVPRECHMKYLYLNEIRQHTAGYHSVFFIKICTYIVLLNNHGILWYRVSFLLNSNISNGILCGILMVSCWYPVHLLSC